MSDEDKNIKQKISIFYLLFCIVFICLLIMPQTIFAQSNTEQKKVSLSVNKNINKQISIKKLKNMNSIYGLHSSVLLPNGKVLLRKAGDTDLNHNEIYNPDDNTFSFVSDRNYYITKGYYLYGIMYDGNILFYNDDNALFDNKLSMELFDYKSEKFKEYKPELPYKYINDKVVYLKIYILSPESLLLKYRIKLSKNNIKWEYFVYNYKQNTYKKVEQGTEYLDSIYRNFQDIFFTVLNNKWYVVVYDNINNSFSATEIEGLEIKPYNIKLFGNNVYFFQNFVHMDNKELKNNKPSLIQEYNMNTKKLYKKGYLYNGGSVKSVVLNDGRILFNSGKYNGKHVELEIYDPQNNTSSFTPPIDSIFGYVQYTLLLDGSVLVTGGFHNNNDIPDGSNKAYRIYFDLKK